MFFLQLLWFKGGGEGSVLPSPPFVGVDLIAAILPVRAEGTDQAFFAEGDGRKSAHDAHTRLGKIPLAIT